MKNRFVLTPILLMALSISALSQPRNSLAAVDNSRAGSLQDLVSELRLDDVLAKITANAQAAVVGKEFALLVDDGEGTRCQSYTSLPLGAVSVLESKHLFPQLNALPHQS